MTTLSEKRQSDNEARLETARQALLMALAIFVEAGTLTRKEADAIEAGMEDELICDAIARACKQLAGGVLAQLMDPQNAAEIW